MHMCVIKLVPQLQCRPILNQDLSVVVKDFKSLLCFKLAGKHLQRAGLLIENVVRAKEVL